MTAPTSDGQSRCHRFPREAFLVLLRLVPFFLRTVFFLAMNGVLIFAQPLPYKGGEGLRVIVGFPLPREG